MSKKRLNKRKDPRLDPDYQEVQLELAPTVLDARQYDLFAYPMARDKNDQRTQVQRIPHD